MIFYVIFYMMEIKNSLHRSLNNNTTYASRRNAPAGMLCAMMGRAVCDGSPSTWNQSPSIAWFVELNFPTPSGKSAAPKSAVMQIELETN